MSRRLVIVILVVLIMGVLGGTVALIVQRISKSANDAGQSDGSGLLELSGPAGELSVGNAESDNDNDGLTNAEEILWGTDANNPDTDGDGTLDGAEVAENRNPTVAGPADSLPANFQPGRNIQQLNTAPLQTDQFFADNLDLTLGTKNYTSEYEGSLKEPERSADTLAKYIQDQPIITQLPVVKSSAYDIQQNSGPKTLAAYLNKVGNLAALSNQSLLISGLAAVQSSNDPAGINALRFEVTLYQDMVKTTAVPPEAVELHKILLGYTELVIATLDQIAGWPNDEIKAMVALRQLDANDQQYIPIIEREIIRLQAVASAG